MSVWSEAVAFLGCWCAASVLIGAVVGHVLSDTPLRDSLAPLRVTARTAMDATVSPAAA